MSYGGSVAAMLLSLRNNSALVSKTRGLKRLSEQLKNASSPKRALAEKEVDPQKAKRVQKEIIERFRAERLRNNIIIGAFSIVLMVLFAGLVWSLLFIPAPQKEMDITLQNQMEQNMETAKKERLTFFIEDGYRWLTKNNFTNALHQFEMATNENPNSYDAQLGLTYTLLKQCSISEVNCEKAKAEYLRMEKKFGQQKNIQKVIGNYLTLIGDSSLTKRILALNSNAD